MNFPLLEALLGGEVVAIESACREDRESSLKAVLVYAAHFTSSDSEPDAITLAQAMVQIHGSKSSSDPADFAADVVDFYHWCANQERIPIDSQLLKSEDASGYPVSVKELELVLSRGNFGETISVVRDLLAIMDNKNYFVEILFRWALTQSPRSVVATRAFSAAVDHLGWKNHFTPFLIIHIMDVLSRSSQPSSEHFNSSDVPDWSRSQIGSIEDLELLSSLLAIHRSVRLLSKDIHARITSLWKRTLAVKKTEKWPTHWSALDKVRIRAAMLCVRQEVPTADWYSKIPF